MEPHNEKIKIGNFELFTWSLGNPNHPSVFIVHGILEHSLRYLELAELFVKNGFQVLSLDLPGHGQSSGKRGDIEKFSDYSDVCLEFLKQKNIRNCFLFGHSMGGLISYQMLEKNQNIFQKIILHNPSFFIGGFLEKILLRILKPVLKPLSENIPSIPILTLIPPKKLVWDLEIQKQIKHDPKMIKWSTTRTLLSLAQASVEAHSKPLHPHKNLWIIQSLQDPVIDWKNNVNYFKNYTHKLKTISWALHEPHNDKNRDEDYKLIIEIFKN